MANQEGVTHAIGTRAQQQAHLPNDDILEAGAARATDVHTQGTQELSVVQLPTPIHVHSSKQHARLRGGVAAGKQPASWIQARHGRDGGGRGEAIHKNAKASLLQKLLEFMQCEHAVIISVELLEDLLGPALKPQHCTSNDTKLQRGPFQLLLAGAWGRRLLSHFLCNAQWRRRVRQRRG